MKESYEEKLRHEKLRRELDDPYMVFDIIIDWVTDKMKKLQKNKNKNKNNN